MRRTTLIFLFVFLVTGWIALAVSTPQAQALQKARELQENGDTQAAIAMLEKAYTDFPKDVEICSTLGFYKGMMAGQTQDFMEAGKWVGEAFTLLDKAVEMAPAAPLPRFHRGILSVNTPEFLGKLDGGVKDLEKLVKLAADPAAKVGKELLAAAMLHLAGGYEKQKLLQKAVDTYVKAEALTAHEAAKARIRTTIDTLKKKIADQAGLKKQSKTESTAIQQARQEMENDPADTDKALALAGQYMNKEMWDQARQVLKDAIKQDPKNLEAHKMLLNIISRLAQKGYDENIYGDTNYRTNLAFEVVNLMEKICELDPDDMEIRLQKGAVNVEMPFFVNRLDQGIEDLNMVLKGNSSDEQKAQALYYLGLAHQKKMTTYWIKVAKDFRKTKAAQAVFKGLQPAMTRLSAGDIKKPCVTIDFVLGFRDELAPQTAVWIEDAEGDFVKTVYVSGFCGFAKEKQIDLPQWGKKSEFRDVDGVTGASIDRGHHIYVWDLKDYRGKQVKPGEYRVRVETHFWPSMMYQRVDARITTGSKGDSAIQEKGNLIPYLKVEFHPAGE